MKENLKNLKEELAKIGKLNSALALISWDMQTKMSKKAVEQRSGMIEYLSGEMFTLKTSNNMGVLTEALMEVSDELNEADRAMVKLAKKEYDETKKIPENRYREFVVATAISGNAWHEAREKDDFAIFKPHLKKIIDFKREFVDYWGYENNKYNTLLNQFEEGLNVEKLDRTFDEVKVGVIELLDNIKKSGKVINKNFLYGDFDKKSQEKFSKFVVSKLGYDFDAGRVDESVHPFTTSFGNKDVRITTNYTNKELTYALFSSIHEGGHGIYEQDIPDEFVWTGLDSALSMSIHESQSRFYENLIGRSKEFWEYFMPYAKYEFEELKDVSIEEFYEAINVVAPSLIRTEADELTYNLHIIIRYEIEKELINGTLDIDEVKEAWDSKYEEYLGVRPKCDSEGILQDIHWSDGSFGYFPSYSLGNLYGAQMLHKMKEDYVNLFEDIKNGKFEGLHNWLKDNVHKHGAIYSPSELIKLITGEDLKAKYFLEYINDKYSKIYFE